MFQQIWTEIGEREQDKDRMFLELEAECMRVYRRKVDSANAERANLRQSLMVKDAELKALVASIGENSPRFTVYFIIIYILAFRPELCYRVLCNS